MSRQGDDIARVQGFVVFVKGGEVGEKTKVRILNVEARFATAQKSRIYYNSRSTTTAAAVIATVKQYQKLHKRSRTSGRI